MVDESYLDRKYFKDKHVFNCPFCNRNNVTFSIVDRVLFDWTDSKQCYAIFVKCASCENISMHLTYDEIIEYVQYGGGWQFKKDIDIDSHIFYSVPTSFFILDKRIPVIIRELVSEAEGCLKMNYLTGASSCMRKAIYELLVIENAQGKDYEDKIKSLKGAYPNTDPDLFDILGHIQEMTSDKIHEQSWDKWNSEKLILIIETLKTVLQDIYVSPKMKNERSKFIQKLFEDVKKKEKPTLP